MPDQWYLNHKPHNSFDSRGYLKPEAINASDQNRGLIEEEQEEEDPYEFIEDAEDSRDLRHRIPLQVDDVADEDEDYEDEALGEDLEDEAEEEYEDADDGDTQEDPPAIPHVFQLPSSKKTSSIFSKEFAFPTAESQDSKMSIDSPFTPKPATFSDSGFSFAKPSIFTKPDPPKPTESTFGHQKPVDNSIFSGTTQASVFPKPVSSSSKPPSEFHQTPETVFKVPQPAKFIESPKKREAEERLKLEAEELRRNSLAREQRIQLIEEETKHTAIQIQTDVIHDMCATLLKEEIEAAKVFERLSLRVSEDVIKDFVDEECARILSEELFLQQRLEEVSNRTKNRMVLKCYRTWQRNALRKRQQREALDSTPVWLPRCSLEACAKSLYRKDQDVVIRSMRRRCAQPEEDSLKYLSPVELKIYSGLKENAKTLDTDPTPIMFWKLVVSWPQLDDRALLWRYRNIMNQYLSPGDCRMDPILKTFKPNPYETLNICVRHCEGIAGEESVVGMDGLFFIAMADEEPKAVARRLTKTLLARQKLMAVPLVFIILGSEPEGKSVEPVSELKDLLKAEYVSEYTVHRETIVDEGSILRLTQTAVLWLSLNRSTAIPLEMDYLRDVVDRCLTDELWLRISGHGPFNAAIKAATDDPRFIVELHNEAVNRLMDSILDPESLMYTDFPGEFRGLLPKEVEVPCSYEYFGDDWKREETRGNIEKILESFVVPPWPFAWPILNTLELHKCVNRYCNTTLGGSNYDEISCNILSNIFFMSDAREKPSFVHVLTEIIKGKTRLLDPELSVVYDKNHIKLFRTLPWWFKSSIFLDYEARLSSRSMDGGHETSVAKRRRLEEEEDRENLEISMVIQEYDDSCHMEDKELTDSVCDKSIVQLSEVQSITGRLETLLEQQRLANKKFEEKLEAALRSEQNINL